MLTCAHRIDHTGMRYHFLASPRTDQTKDEGGLWDFLWEIKKLPPATEVVQEGGPRCILYLNLLMLFTQQIIHGLHRIECC